MTSCGRKCQRLEHEPPCEQCGALAGDWIPAEWQRIVEDADPLVTFYFTESESPHTVDHLFTLRNEPE